MVTSKVPVPLTVTGPVGESNVRACPLSSFRTTLPPGKKLLPCRCSVPPEMVSPLSDREGGKMMKIVPRIPPIIMIMTTGMTAHIIGLGPCLGTSLRGAAG